MQRPLYADSLPDDTRNFELTWVIILRIRTDLSKSGRFTVWESGGWQKKRDSEWGSAVIIGGINGEALDVLFDVNPTLNVTHACFYAEQDQMVATAYLRPGDTPGKYKATIGLYRISELSSHLVQGNPTPKAETKLIWTTSMRSTDDSICDRLPARLDGDSELHEQAVHLLKLAFEKARTPPENQRIFWGNPRASQPDYSSTR